MDVFTTTLVSELVAKYDVAVQKEDLNTMMAIIALCCESPNQPFRRELCRQLEI
jgi:hypothetical protein